MNKLYESGLANSLRLLTTMSILLLSLPRRRRVLACFPFWAPTPTVSDRTDPIRVVLPFNNQASAHIVRVQLKDLSQKIDTTIQPVFVSHKIEQDLKLREAKPPVVNQECLVYKFKCDLCETGYVIYQTRGRVFHPISKRRQVVEKKRRSRVFFNKLQGVWISDETPFRMFDIASQTINNSWRKSKQKSSKFYYN